MEIRKLEENDAEQFSDLIINMYSNLNNLEWFSPMPYDIENVKTIITKPRFYVLGAFIENKLVGVSSLDYKCGKLFGKIDFPEGSNETNTVEIGFNIVHSEFRGQRIMQQLIDVILKKIEDDKFEWVFAKVHKDNIASFKSFLNKGFDILTSFKKGVCKDDFISLSSEPFFSKEGKENAKISLEKNKENEEIIVDYKIYTKKIK